MSNWQAWLYLAAALIPLGAFALQFVLIRVLKRANAYVATGAIALSCVLSAVGFVSYVGTHWPAGEGGEGHEVAAGAAWTLEHDWVLLGDGLPDSAGQPLPALKIPLGIRVDGLAATMFLMVTFIATLIHLYSMGYMSEDPGYPRFFAYLSLFCFSMLGLVASATIFQVFMFWELVGLCSYLLIGFWYQEKSNSNAANKAFIVNRVGDAGMILGLGLLWTSFGTFNIHEINTGLRDGRGQLNVVSRAVDSGTAQSMVELRDPTTGQPRHDFPAHDGRTIPLTLLTIAGLGIFAGCVGKSAQFPLHVWLPDAMAGPTPVSALIHAATMVAAGVYLVGRFFPLFTPPVQLVIAYTGAITLFIGATIACVQTDYKKVLAYSTVSQLGFMMLGLGVGGWAAGLFHLVTHAFFKALLFLGAGSVYHAVHTYEMPGLGGLKKKMPRTAMTMLIGTAAISGVPFLSGFYSKDAILASAYAFVHEPGNGRHMLLLIVPIVGATLTAFYMFRMWFLLFTGESRSAHHETEAHAHAAHHDSHAQHHGDPVAHAHESPPIMTVPLMVLAAFAIFVGWPALVVPVVGGTPVLEHLLASGAPIPLHEHGQELQVIALLMSLVIAAVGIYFAGAFYYWRTFDAEKAARRIRPVYTFLRHKWYFDEMYDLVFVRPTLAVARFVTAIDRSVIDTIVNGTALFTAALSRIEGLFDANVVDGLVNLFGKTIYGIGRWSRTVETGRVRSYLMLLVVGLVVLFVGMYRWIGG